MQAATAEELASYDAATLCDAVARVAETYAAAEIWVGILAGGRACVAGVDSRGRFEGGEGAPRRPLYCMAKVLAGTLALRASCEQHIDFESDLGESDSTPLQPWTRGVTMRQLFGHTHGIDLSHVRRTGIDAYGCIDVPALAGSLGASLRLFEPGELYSYGNAGCWLAAAVLERICGKSYAELLRERVLRPAGIDCRRPGIESGLCCPSVGGDLLLSVPEWLQFLGWFLQQDELLQHPELRAPVPPAPPGWCFEKGACAGWKSFGSGWLGNHTAFAVDNHSMAVRLHPQRKIAIVVDARVGSTYGANTTLARLFGHIVPEFASVRIPRLLPTSPSPDEAAERAGIYGDSISRLRVTTGERGALGIEVFDDLRAWRDNKPQIRFPLRAASDGAYVAQGLIFHFVSVGSSRYTHLWNSRHVFRRL